MPRSKISEYSATANSNTDVAGVNVDEGCAPSGINNAIRAVMGHLKDFQAGTNSDSFNGPTNGAHNGSVGATTPAAGTFTTLSATGNVTLGDASSDTLNVGNGGIVKDASGNVGIGTSSPAVRTEISGTEASVSLRVNTQNSGVSASNFSQIQLADNGTVRAYWRNVRDGSGATQFAYNSILAFLSDANGTPTERARIDSSGNLLVGTTSAVGGAARIGVLFAGNATNGLNIQDSTTTSGTVFQGFSNSSGTTIGSISRVGITNAVIYNTASDQRLKSNIEDATPVLDKLMQVQVRQYDWTEGDLHQDYGFVAQELEPLLSGIVTKGKTEEDTWQVDYSRLTPHLVKAIQEQQAMIASQSELITTLTERITALEQA